MDEKLETYKTPQMYHNLQISWIIPEVAWNKFAKKIRFYLFQFICK